MTTPVKRGTTNRNDRGSSYSRRSRRQWVIDTWGNGVQVSCYRFARCGEILTLETLTLDRIVPGCQGGTYARTNIRPACAFCNSSTGGATRRAVTRVTR